MAPARVEVGTWRRGWRRDRQSASRSAQVWTDLDADCRPRVAVVDSGQDVHGDGLIDQPAALAFGSDRQKVMCFTSLRNALTALRVKQGRQQTFHPRMDESCAAAGGLERVKVPGGEPVRQS